jgi:hypothetical protein
MVKRKAVWVKWVDSYNLFGDRWGDPEKVPAECKDPDAYCYTLGWIVHEDDQWLALAGSQAPAEVGSVMVIPKTAIRKRKMLELPS